jgi:hypothetical protein
MPDRPPTGWWRTLLIVVAGALAYSNSVSGPFIFDDLLSVVGNPQIREWSRLSAVLSPERESPVAGRPLVNLSLAINYALGGLDPFGYHIINIALCSHGSAGRLSIWHSRRRCSGRFIR